MTRGIKRIKDNFEIGFRVESVHRRRLAQRNNCQMIVGAAIGGGLFFLVFLVTFIIKLLEGEGLGEFGIGERFFGGLAVMGIGGILGWGNGLRNPPSRRDSASLIDRFCDGKDRVLTAWESETSKSELSPMANLQYADALDLIAAMNPAEIVPYHWPRNVLRIGILGVCLGFAPCFFLNEGNQKGLRDQNFSTVQGTDQTKRIQKESFKESFKENENSKKGTVRFSLNQEKVLAELEILANRFPQDKSIQKITETFRQRKAEGRQKRDISQDSRKDGLALYSEAQELLKERRKLLGIDAIQERIDQWAATLESSSATHSAGEAFRQGNFAEAASQWKEILWEEMDSSKREEMSQNLQSASKKMRELGEDDFADDLESLAKNLTENLFSSDKTSRREKTDIAAVKERIVSRMIDLGEKYASLLRTAQAMDEEISRLDREKSEFASRNDLITSQTTFQQSSSRKEESFRSAGDSKRWGGGSIGDPRTGTEKTYPKQDGDLWVIGESSENETSGEMIVTGEMTETSERAEAKSREIDIDFRKMSETPAPSYPIPWSRRNLVRRYFESRHFEVPKNAERK